MGKPQFLSRLYELNQMVQSIRGIFTIWINGGVKWDQVVIDGLLPTIMENSMITYAFSRSKKAAYFCLLEKAFAKIYGSYAELENVPVESFIQGILGLPVEVRKFEEFSNNEDIWEKMKEAFNQGAFFCFLYL